MRSSLAKVGLTNGKLEERLLQKEIILANRLRGRSVE